MENPVLPYSCVTPAGTSIEVQNEWEDNTHTHMVEARSVNVKNTTTATVHLLHH